MTDKPGEVVVLVCGSRTWEDTDAIRRVLTEICALRGIRRVIHGDAQGADRRGADAAASLFLEVVPYAANWQRYGNSAGPVRNQEMLDDGKPDLVLAFAKDLETSAGTRDTVFRANRAGVPVRLYAR